MKGYSVYNAIQQLKAKGFKKATVARQLDINRRTGNPLIRESIKVRC